MVDSGRRRVETRRETQESEKSSNWLKNTICDENRRFLRKGGRFVLKMCCRNKKARRMARRCVQGVGNGLESVRMVVGG